MNNLIKKYLFSLIYVVSDIFIEVNNKYIEYIQTTYCDNEYKNINFVMIKNFDSLDEIKQNKKIFLELHSNSDSEYIIGLRRIPLFPNIMLYKKYILNYFYNINKYKNIFEEKVFDDDINNYAVYKLNKTNKLIQIDLIDPNHYNIIKKNLITNYIIISNILSYIDNNKYPEISYDSDNYDWINLFNKWIEPIEPYNIFYDKLLEKKINKKIIEIDGEIYTDILCFRNLIQLEYKNAQKIFYSNIENLDNNIENQYIIMPILYSTYRINKQGKIIIILH